MTVVIGLGVLLMARHSEAQASATENANLPTVSVTKVTRLDLSKDDTVPAEFRPYEEVELHAKVSGYVKEMKVDFGDKVKKGQLLATLEVPELQDDLQNALATEAKAEADYTNADLIYSRLMGVNHDHPNLVAQQDLDTALANDHAAAAAAAAAKADADKYQTLIGYTRITAPFDGVITRRFADPGALIQAGTSSDTQSLPLVRVSDNYRLRLDFPVDVDYVQDIHAGDPVQVQVSSLGNKTFTGDITRFTRDVDDKTRQMTTEIEVPNPDLELVPGMYAYVNLQVEKRSQVLAVPTQAVMAGTPPTVYVVNRDNDLEQHPVTLGLEMPDKDEVISGLHEGDLVVVGNPSGFQAGQKVQPEPVQLSMSDKGRN
ncbi:MAG TPA: efflux RND transporter periplasmic adaptor subunit [Verrucomicrobiae bacterium]|jgi:RND family efflux transporter MFP subunit